jgi:DNA-binding MarR family transcriptional regulator
MILENPESSMPLRTPSDFFEDLLLYRIYRLSSVAGAMMVRLCEGSYGITRREWRILALLHGNDGLTPSAMAEKVQLDRARTSRAIGALVKKKLIVRTPAVADRRVAQLAMTTQGKKVYAELMPQVQDINQRILATLTDEESAQFRHSLDRLRVGAQGLYDEMMVDLPKTQRRLGKKGQ